MVYAVDGRCVKDGHLHALILPERNIVSVKSKKHYWQETKSLLPYSSLCVSVKSLRTTTWAKIRRIAEREAIEADFKERLQQWISVMETLAEDIARKTIEQSSSLIGHISREDRKYAWPIVDNHPAAGLLMQAHQGNLAQQIVMAKLATPAKLLMIAEAFGFNISDQLYKPPKQEVD